MGRRMPNMVVRNGWHYYRKTVPEGLRKAVGRREIKETLDTRDPVVAKARWAVVSAKVEEELALLRRRGRAEEFDTSSLTNWEIHSFSGPFYRELVAKNEKNPGDPKVWEQLLSTSDLAVPEKHRTEFERKRTIHSGMNALPCARCGSFRTAPTT